MIANLTVDFSFPSATKTLNKTTFHISFIILQIAESFTSVIANGYSVAPLWEFNIKMHSIHLLWGLEVRN